MRTIVNTAPDGIVTVDEQGVVESLNPAAERIFGYQAHEVIGRTVALLIPRLYAEEYGRYIMDKYLDTTQTNGMAKDGELVGFRKDKTTFPLDLALSEVYLGGRRIFTSIIRDLTERKLLEEQLRQAQKMEAVGRLAGGIAHDFNNILTIITGNCQLILKNLSSNDPLYKDIEQINRAGERAASLTRQLLAFSRKQILQPKVLNLNAVITNLERMLRPLINEDIELCAILEPDLGQVEADPGQIEQVIMNLILNARDAMPHGGTLTIETTAVYLDQAYTRQHIGVKAGRYIMLAISDTGLGMDAEVKDHIFEPFFTTKEQSKGTGLGLATVYGIVNQSGGHIWVYSEPDKGTTFKIYLPRVDKPVEAITSPPTLSTQAQGMETILRVEDGFI
jgi:PAS domain S-box-containing protein